MMQRRGAAEAAGWGAALALALIAVAVVATTSSWLLYRDGDSVVVALMADSLRRGDGQDWALSPVLFLPETAVYGALSLLGLGTTGTLTLNAVLNLLAVYGGIRLVAGRFRPGTRPVRGSVLAFAAFVALILLEGPEGMPGFHLALLTATTTYYSATVVGTLVVAGLLRRLLDGAALLRMIPPIVLVDQAGAALAHLAEVSGATVPRWNGVLWFAAVLALFVACVVIGLWAWIRRDVAVIAVAALAVSAPIAATVLVVVAGTDADRYLQPWVFLPVVALAVASPAAPVPRAVGATLAGALVVGGVVAVPVAIAAASREDAGLACVTRWVEQSGRTGAGQFWTVRAPKLALADPSQLVQVDHTLRPYEWLVNRAEGRGPVTFLVEDAASAPFELPAGIATSDATPVACGRYTILDFGSRVLPLGEPRN
ncbi:MAG TPA: hypothetical protein DHW40_01120 [Microbacterium sp.]|nr:hypothetical protein [Microbacterium sp.]